jgi:hypothetical protein
MKKLHALRFPWSFSMYLVWRVPCFLGVLYSVEAQSQTLYFLIQRSGRETSLLVAFLHLEVSPPAPHFRLLRIVCIMK